jgi:polyisoprenoid-binding protein YceI
MHGPGLAKRAGVKRFLAIVGAAALFLWTGLGLFAWSSAAQRVTVILAEEQNKAEEQAEARVLALADELGALRQDVRALASAMSENLQALNDGLLANQDEHAAALELRVAAWREEAGSQTVSPSKDELAGLLRELETIREALQASSVSDSATQLVPTLAASERASEEIAAPPIPLESEVAAPVQVSAPEAPRRKSFLAFKLPSDDFRFDERRTWAILPSLSRVGFDAKTTLHDFTATTSSLEGELEADLSHPASAPRARLRVQASTLASGNGERDEAMREHLAVAEHPNLDLELTGFEAQTIDLGSMTASGTAHGRMTVRGVTREVSMPVKLSIDDARRLCVEGEMPLDLTAFDVPVPKKLGLISMEKVVRVWISLRLRVNPRTEG